MTRYDTMWCIDVIFDTMLCDVTGVLVVLAGCGAEGVQHHPCGVEQGREVGRGRAAAEGDGDEGYPKGRRQLRLSHHCVSPDSPSPLCVPSAMRDVCYCGA